LIWFRWKWHACISLHQAIQLWCCCLGSLSKLVVTTALKIGFLFMWCTWMERKCKLWIGSIVHQALMDLQPESSRSRGQK
jgi:hypothetical protein